MSTVLRGDSGTAGEGVAAGHWGGGWGGSPRLPRPRDGRGLGAPGSGLGALLMRRRSLLLAPLSSGRRRPGSEAGGRFGAKKPCDGGKGLPGGLGPL